MLGSTLATWFQNDFIVYEANRDDNFLNLSSSKQIKLDLNDTRNIEQLCRDKKIHTIVNCVGVTKQKINSSKLDDCQSAIKVNSLFPYKLARIGEKESCKVIQIATDCVFSGNVGQYSEFSQHDPSDIYGKSKSLGEIESENFLNLRVSIIGTELRGHKSLLDWVRLNNSNSINGYENHTWNGITTLAYSKIVSGIISNDLDLYGTFHIVPSDSVSKYELVKLIARIFRKTEIEIVRTSASESINRTLSTNFPLVNSNLWLQAGYTEIPKIETLLSELSEWIESTMEPLK